MTASGVRGLGIVAALVAVAAGSGCGHATPAAAPAARPSVDQAAQQRVHRALLAAAELPLGFQQQDSAEASAIGCAGIDRLYLTPRDTARATVSFGHAITQAFVNETISLQAGAAAADVAALRRATTDCATFAGARNVSYRVTALSGIRHYGQATAAIRVTAAQQEARPVDLVAVQVGDLVIVIANADFGRVDTALTQTIVQRAVDKATRLG